MIRDDIHVNDVWWRISCIVWGRGGGGVVITTGYGRIDRLMGGGGGQYDLRFTPQTEWEQVKKKKHKKDIY